MTHWKIKHVDITIVAGIFAWATKRSTAPASASSVLWFSAWIAAPRAPTSCNRTMLLRSRYTSIWDISMPVTIFWPTKQLALANDVQTKLRSVSTWAINLGLLDEFVHTEWSLWRYGEKSWSFEMVDSELTDSSRITALPQNAQVWNSSHQVPLARSKITCSTHGHTVQYKSRRTQSWNAHPQVLPQEADRVA